MELVVCQEQYGSQPIRRKYIRTEWGSVRSVDQTRRFTSVPQFFRSVFLPQGYPDSVSEDYLQYQLWDTLQAFCSCITGTLAAQAVLKGVGVGDESATLLAATITWILKSGTGMAGQIIFAWKKSSQLDSDCKRWRLFADILNDAAICVEMLAPLFMEYFRAIVCVAGVMKAIVGCAGGATRAALTQHQARRNNMADVSAKDGSQETLVNLTALLFSLILIPSITGNQTLVWALYFTFTTFHLYANYRAVTSVTMETFNMTRLHIVVQRYLQSDRYLMTVKEANLCEPVIFSPSRWLSVHNGVSADFLSTTVVDVDKLLSLFKNLNYLVNVDIKTGEVFIVLHSGADSYDQLRACFHAEVLEYAMKASRAGAECAEPFKTLVEAITTYDVLTVMSKSFDISQKLFSEFLGQASQRGWNTKTVQLGADEWRANWSVYGISEKKYY